MKTELIEYHRARASHWRAHMAHNDPAVKKHADFHERAVAWLESLKTTAPTLGVEMQYTIVSRDLKDVPCVSQLSLMMCFTKSTSAHAFTMLAIAQGVAMNFTSGEKSA